MTVKINYDFDDRVIPRYLPINRMFLIFFYLFQNLRIQSAAFLCDNK